MAEEFQTGLCSGSWWSTDAVEAKISCDYSVTSVSGSTVSFHDLRHPSPPVPSAGGFLLDSPVSTGYGASSPTVDWNQNFQSHDDERGGGSFHGVLQEDHLSSTKSCCLVPDNGTSQGRIGDSSSTNLFQDVSQAFLADQQHLNTTKEYVAGSAAYVFPPNCNVQVLPEAVNFRNEMGNAWSKLPQCFKLPMFEQQQQPAGQLQFSTSNQPFLNAPTVASVGNTRFVAQAFLGKSSSNNPNPSKPNNQGLREISSSVARRASSEQSFKKPRVETPSPLPAFKVRKEKLGDRITALQQLVSPFGKADTASVLHEAIEYIKFLHDQVNVLSTPYLKNAHQSQDPQNYEKAGDGEVTKKDLRSRGLCLVPISSTFAVANEPTVFWTPTFSGKIN